MNTNEDILRKVEELAAASHGEQKRKYTPEPYIVHPVRVMKLCREYTDDECILSAALLHDVLEDTPVTEDELLNALNNIMGVKSAGRTLHLVKELTDVYIKKDYPRLNRKERKRRERARAVSASAESQTIKYADIIDNCREIVRHDRDFARVFLSECKMLLSEMDKGNSELYRLAVKTVNENLADLR